MEPFAFKKEDLLRSPRPTASGEGESVLVVDDDPSITRYLMKLLKFYKCEVDSAENCKDAFDMLLKKNYSLLLLDVKLPDMSGIEFFKECKDALEYTQTIVMTGAPDFDTAIQIVKEGAFDYLPNLSRTKNFLKK